MKLGSTVGLFADIHGSVRTLERALEVCRAESVDTIALLGDLFDRPEQADPCAAALDGWEIVGVWGNHEREVAHAAATGELAVRESTVRLLTRLRERVVIDDICLMHEVERWGHDDPISALFGRNGHGSSSRPEARITFAGHTHFRHARDERGPIDVARGSLVLDPLRRYLINPGALIAGQFAILERETGTVRFRHIER